MFPGSCSSSVSGIYGIYENHNTHLAPGFTLNDLVPAPANVVVLPGPLGPCLWGPHTASTRCPPSRGTASLRVARRTLDSALLLGIRPSHQSTTRYGAAPFQPLRSLFLVLVEFKPSPLSLFGSVPAAASTFPLSLQLLLGRVLFLHSLPCLRPLSTHKNSSVPSVASGSPGSPLCAAYLLNSVVQVVQIVVLILRSVF